MVSLFVNFAIYIFLDIFKFQQNLETSSPKNLKFYLLIIIIKSDTIELPDIFVVNQCIVIYIIQVVYLAFTNKSIQVDKLLSKCQMFPRLINVI